MIEYIFTERPLVSYVDTIKEIFRLSKNYRFDLLDENKFKFDFSKASIFEVFNFLKNLPYVKDPEGNEFVTRPFISIQLAGTGHFLDCDDKTTIFLSWYFLKYGINSKGVRVAVTGRGEKPKHVFPEFFLATPANLSGEWVPMDATYDYNFPGRAMYVPGYKRVFYPV